MQSNERPVAKFAPSSSDVVFAELPELFQHRRVGEVAGRRADAAAERRDSSPGPRAAAMLNASP